MRSRKEGRPTSPSVGNDALCGAVPPGPLDGLPDVLSAVVPQVKGDDGQKRPNLDPLGTLVEDCTELAEQVDELRRLLLFVSGPGASDGQVFVPGLAARREAAAKVVGHAKRALALTGEIRPLLAALVPVLTAASALVEHQTPGVQAEPVILDVPF